MYDSIGVIYVYLWSRDDRFSFVIFDRFLFENLFKIRQKNSAPILTAFKIIIKSYFHKVNENFVKLSKREKSG